MRQSVHSICDMAHEGYEGYVDVGEVALRKRSFLISLRYSNYEMEEL